MERLTQQEEEVMLYFLEVRPQFHQRCIKSDAHT